MNLVSAAHRLRGGFRKAEPSHLARAHQVGHRSHRVLNGRVGIDAMLVVEVDHVHLQALEARLARIAHVLRCAIDAPETAIRAAHVAELGGEDHALAPPRERAPHELLVAPHAVHVGGIEEGHAEVERAMDGRDRFRFVAPAVELRHPHAAQPDGRHFQSCSQLARLHDSISS